MLTSARKTHDNLSLKLFVPKTEHFFVGFNSLFVVVILFKFETS